MEIKEEILYCDYCGGVNKPSAVICEHCQRKLGYKHSAFLIFLKANTKDKLLGGSKDKMFDRIKNFLLSHVYGVVVSILVVTTVCAYIPQNDTYIKKVSTVPQIAVQVPEETQEPEIVPVITELSDDDRMEIFTKLNEYSVLCDTEKLGDIGATPTMSFSDILADLAGVGYTYGGAHDLRATGIHAYAVQNQPDGKYASSSTTSTYLLVNDELTSELGKTLRDSGYEVAENTFSGLGYFDGRVVDFTDFYNLSPDFRFDYCMVYVKIDGEWYIAEDKRI